MGLIRGNIIGSEMNYESLSTGANFDIVVIGIGGSRRDRTATIKVNGIAHLDEIILRKGEPNTIIVEPDTIFVEGVKVGIAPNSISRPDKVEIFYHADYNFFMNHREYTRSEYK